MVSEINVIINGIKYVPEVLDSESDSNKVKSLFSAINDFTSEIDTLLKDGRESVKENLADGLTVGAIELEGYVRGLITVKNYLEYLKTHWYPELFAKEE